MKFSPQLKYLQTAAQWNFAGGNIVSKTGINLCTVGIEKYCQIPNVGKKGGYITRESDEKVLEVSQGLHIAEWEKKEDRPDQTWERSPFDKKSYFTLTNKNTKQMLHGLRGSYQGNSLNNGKPDMPSKDLNISPKTHLS